MKVRIQGNSLRFRLKQFEVEAFAQTNFVKEEVIFSSQASMRLQFILRAATTAKIEVEYQPSKIVVCIPQTIAKDWTTTDLVGIEAKAVTASGEVIKVLIEKDFKCLDGKEEENIGSYPNPVERC